MSSSRINLEGVKEIILPKRKKINIFADFETFLYTDNFPLWEYKEDKGFSNILADKCEVVPWLLGAYTPNIEIKGVRTWVNQDDYRFFYSAEYPHSTFFDLIKKYWDLGYLPVIWFHNASYDLTAAIETSFRDLDPDLNIYFVSKENKNFLLGAMESPKYGFKVKFGDTLLYKRISLEKIGDMFGSPKGEIPYTMMDIYIRDSVVYFTDWYTGKIESVLLDKCVEYVKQDVFLTFKYFQQLQEETELITITINGSPSSRVRTSTQGVHSRSLLDLWMHKQTKGKFENAFKFVVDKEEGMRMQRSLTGGYTTINRNCFSFVCPEGWTITSYDCNSMYPYIMTLGLPYGDLLLEKPEEESIEWVCLACKDVVWKGTLSCLKTPPIPDNKQSYNFEDPMEIYIMREDLEWIKENSSGEFLEFFSVWQKKTYVAGAFVNYLYDLRMRVKDDYKNLEKEKEKAHPSELAKLTSEIETLKGQEQGIKTTMNSLYGKMCEKSYMTQTVYFEGKFRKAKDENASYRCTLSGAYIALSGRIMVYKKIKETIEAGFIFLYADTDSVKFAYPKNEQKKVEDIFGFNTGKLGQWKNEGSWSEFYTPGKKKKYALIDTREPHKSVLTLSGISNNHVNALINGLYETPEQTMDDIRYIWSSTSNVLFKNTKNNSIRTNKFDQLVIHPISVSTNISIKKNTAEVFIENGRYVLKKYGS